MAQLPQEAQYTLDRIACLLEGGTIAGTTPTTNSISGNGADGAVNATVFRQVNRARNWWDLPTPVALLNLLPDDHGVVGSLRIQRLPGISEWALPEVAFETLRDVGGGHARGSSVGNTFCH